MFWIIITVNTMMTALVISGKETSLPMILGLQDIDNCTYCIVGEVGEKFNVSCVINNINGPLDDTFAIGNESYTPRPYNSTSTTYFVFFLLQEHHHMQNVSFSVMDANLSSPLQATAHMYVIRPPSVHTFLVPETLRAGEDVNITCTVDGGRPIPIVYFNISGIKLSSTYVHTSSSPNKQVISLTTFKREWSRENITCCRYNKWYQNKLECSQPKQVDYLYPPLIKFNISGSVLNITEGKQSNVKCLAESFPASNIYWIEDLGNENVTKKQCNKSSNCVLSFHASVVTKKRFYCATQYPTSTDNKHLTVNILEKADEEKLREKKINFEQVSKRIIKWIVLGSCLLLAGLIIAFLLIVVIRKRRQNPIEQDELRVSYHANTGMTRNLNNPFYDQENQNEAAHARELVDEIPEYSQPVKRKTRENVDNTYSKGNKAGSSSQIYLTEDGQSLYADLDFDPNETPSDGYAVKRRDSPTEYADIDYVKTIAEKDLTIAREKADEEPEYFQPVKNKTTGNVDNLYSQVNKAESPSQPHRAENGQLLYAELVFDPKENPSTGDVVKRRDSPTEYVEIDFVKTKAQKDITESENNNANQKSNNCANGNDGDRSICKIM